VGRRCLRQLSLLKTIRRLVGGDCSVNSGDLGQLKVMLDQGIRYDPWYRPVDSSDHLPKALCAMQ